MDELLDFLRAWEGSLDPLHPEQAQPPARVLGYGEISTVLELQHPLLEGYAIKRMPMFRSREEVESYIALHQEYLARLAEAGIATPPTEPVWFERPQGGYAVYVLQEKLPPGAIGNQILHRVELGDARRLVLAVLEEIRKVFRFNTAHKGRLELGFDGQISNWAVEGLDPTATSLPDGFRLLYFDTTTPLIQKDGQEQLNPELFLRCAPSFLVFIIRLLFLEDVMTRYYDFRKVVVDLIANFHKEKRAEWIPAIVEAVNAWAQDTPELSGSPLTVDEIRAYYREDAFIWRFYLAARKLDRGLHHLLRREYPYILPEKIER